MLKSHRTFKYSILVSLVVLTLLSGIILISFFGLLPPRLNIFRLIPPDFEWVSINVSTSIQGDAHLIRFGKKYVLIDTGTAQEARNGLLNYLNKNNINKIDTVILSHFHFDHYQGLNVLLDRGFKIGEVYVNFPSEESCKREWWGCKIYEMDEINKRLSERKIPILPILSYMKFKFGYKSGMRVLNAFDSPEVAFGQNDINDMSAIIRIRHGRFNALLTGDLDKSLGNYLLHINTDLKADILKVPHHGAEGTATNDFFDAVAAKVFIVPSFKSLWCSDRSKRIRDYAKSKKIKTYVNGYHGDISIKSNGYIWWVETQLPEKNSCN